MFGLRTILFPTDLTPSSRLAFLYAVRLAVQAGADLHIVHARPERLHGPEELAHFIPFDEVRLREQLGIDLETWHAAVGAGMERRVHVVRADLHGLPPDVAIVAYAAHHDVDLIVMGTHGRRGVWHVLLGSVAEAVIRWAPCPVMTVRGADEACAVRYDRIVVPVDFSPFAGRALAYARRLAVLHHATVALLFVAEEHVVSIPFDTGLPAVARLRADPTITAQAEAALRQLDAAHPSPEVPVTYHVRHGDAAHEIAAFVREGGADLVVMTRRGHTRPSADGLSSVTERVVRTVSCPVVTLPSEPAPTEVEADDGREHEPAARPHTLESSSDFTSRYQHGPL